MGQEFVGMKFARSLLPAKRGHGANDPPCTEFSEGDQPLIWISFTAMDNFCPLVSLAHVGDLLSCKAGHNDTAAATTDTEGEGTPAPLLRFGKGHECSLSLGCLESPAQEGAPGAGQLHCPHSAPQGQCLSPLQNHLSAF